MSMDEMLLQELYGSEEVQAEEQIKQAQVELVEAVAAEAGVDLNELDDEELEKRKIEGVPKHPDSQTPWQEIYRNGVSQIDKGAVLEDAVKFQDVKKDFPRTNH